MGGFPSSSPTVDFTGKSSVVAGGLKNSALGDFCIVSGGFSNRAEPNDFITISGGTENKAEAEQSTITGGFGNSICNECTSGTIVAGQNNTIEGEKSTECTIGGGIRNSIKNCNAGTIAGGEENQVTGNFAVVGGGQKNIASGEGSVIPGGRENKASGDFSIAFGRRAEAKDDRSLVINLQEGGGKLKSNGKSTFSAAAMRFVFQIGQVRAVIDDTSIVELNAILNPSGGQRNLRSIHLMTPTRIRELIQEQKMKHEEQQDIVSKLQQELASLVEGEEHHLEHGLELKKSQDQDKDSDRSLEKAVTGAATTEEQGKNNKAVGTGSVVNGGEQNTASGSLSVVGGGQKNTASDTMSVVGGGEKNKAAGQTAVVAGGKENETKGGFTFIGGGEKNQVQAKWASVLGGYKNLAKGNYATVMGQNALANQDLSIAIGLQVDKKNFVRANQVGYWVLRAERIELRVGVGADDALVLTKKNIKKFRSILKGTRRRHLEARSDEEQNLLTKLEELEDLVEYQEVEIDELEGDIQNFYRNFEEVYKEG